MKLGSIQLHTPRKKDAEVGSHMIGVLASSRFPTSRERAVCRCRRIRRPIAAPHGVGLPAARVTAGIPYDPGQSAAWLSSDSDCQCHLTRYKYPTDCIETLKLAYLSILESCNTWAWKSRSRWTLNKWFKWLTNRRGHLPVVHMILCCNAECFWKWAPRLSAKQQPTMTFLQFVCLLSLDTIAVFKLSYMAEWVTNSQRSVSRKRCSIITSYKQVDIMGIHGLHSPKISSLYRLYHGVRWRILQNIEIQEEVILERKLYSMTYVGSIWPVPCPVIIIVKQIVEQRGPLWLEQVTLNGGNIPVEGQ